VPALAATSADGQNLRPDIAQQLEAIADEAKGRIDSMVKENKVNTHPSSCRHSTATCTNILP
jgi:hypothetical protein